MAYYSVPESEIPLLTDPVISFVGVLCPLFVSGQFAVLLGLIIGHGDDPEVPNFQKIWDHRP